MSLPEADLDEVAARLGPDEDALRDRTILVTGGTGFFGRWIVESLLHVEGRRRLGLRLVLLSRDVATARARFAHCRGSSVLTFVEGDVRSPPSMPVPIDLVLHGAASSDARSNRADPDGVVATIVDGTRAVLALARTGGASRVLFISSGAVYGEVGASRLLVDESTPSALDPLDPTATYGVAKACAEHLCALASRDESFEVPVARCFAFLGPLLPLDAHFAAGNFLRDALAGRAITIQGDGTSVRSYLYPTDLVVALVRVLVRGRGGRAYNVGSDVPVSIAELGETIADLGGTTVRILGRVDTTTAVRSRYVPDVTRLRSELAFDPAVSLRDAIARTLAFHR